MIRQEVVHVLDAKNLKAAPVRPENVVAYRQEDGSLTDLGPSLQVLKHNVLAEVVDQVYDTVLRKEVRQLLSPQDPHFVKVHVQVPEDNGVPEALQGLLQFRQVIQH